MDVTKHGDFKRYFDTTLNRNYWVLGYFGGGSINVAQAMQAAEQYAVATGVPLDTVQIDEIQHSRRFKRFKVLFSTEVAKKEADAYEMENVFGWLCD